MHVTQFTKSIWVLLFFNFVCHYFWAWQWPILNDESYYWDWSRQLQLSYIDAPPAVAWIGYINSLFDIHFFKARAFVPCLYLASTLFLLNSALILAEKQKINTNHSLTQISCIVILLFFSIPIFNLYGVLLHPDGILFFAFSGSLYFALKACSKSSKNQTHSLSLIDGVCLGFFLGLGIVSKYQACPAALGIFIGIVFFRGIKKTFQKDLLFWFWVISIAGIIASPLFIWNFQNNFASFRFQGQHGFLSWNINFRGVVAYFAKMILILLPWNFYLFYRQIELSIKEKKYKNLDIIPICAFASVFVFITSSVFGKVGLVHWITPAFLFLIPLVATNWGRLTQKNKNFWLSVNIVSICTLIVVFSTAFSDIFQKILVYPNAPFLTFRQNIQNQIFIGIRLHNLKDFEKNVQAQMTDFNFKTVSYPKILDKNICSTEPYLASFNWRFTSQLAFHLQNNPRVLNLEPTRSTYYTWRDNFENIEGCPVYVIGEKKGFTLKAVSPFIQIDSIDEFMVEKKYSSEKVAFVFIKGTFKDKSTHIILDQLKKNVLY